MSTHADRAALFRHLHTQDVLRLANAWDAGSARLIERLGAQAVATTSAGATTMTKSVIRRVARTATRTTTRRYITALASAIPAGSAPPASPEPSRWASDWVTAAEL